MRKLLAIIALGCLFATSATSQQQGYMPYQLNLFYYYPYHYYPHNYWPAMAPKYPEAPNMPYQKPPAYMAYPPFHEPGWRYELGTPHRYYRGSHFWLDQF